MERSKEKRFARVIVVNTEGKVLLVRQRSRDRSLHCFPGGKVESGEDPKLAARRELAEELGLCVAGDRLRFVCRQRFKFSGESWQGSFYMMPFTGLKPTLLESPKVDSAVFYDIDEMHSLEGLDRRSVVDVLRRHLSKVAALSQKTNSFSDGELFTGSLKGTETRRAH